MTLEQLLSDAYAVQELVAATGAEQVEYVEKQFDGPSMSDDEWSSL
jgi:hypothetical protein